MVAAIGRPTRPLKSNETDRFRNITPVPLLLGPADTAASREEVTDVTGITVAFVEQFAEVNVGDHCPPTSVATDPFKHQPLMAK